MPRLPLLLVAASLATLVPSSTARDWWIAKPSNTGVPGELVQLTRWAPDGTLWVAARWPFWGEAGLGIWDPETRIWTVHSNWESPLPSEFINDLEFEDDGTAWIATGGGLVRFDGEAWTVWNASNSPLAFDNVRDLALAPDGHVWVNSSSSSSGGDAVWDFDGDTTWIAHAVPDQIPFAAPWTDLSQVFVTGDGHVWAANETLMGVAEWDGATWTLRGEGVNRFDEMAEDGLGNLWLNGNLVGGLDAFHRWDGTSFTTWSFPEPTTLTADPDDGSVVFGNWFGTVLRTSDGGQTFQTILSGLNQVFDLAPRSVDGELWVGTIGAVGRFTTSGSWIEDFNSYNSGMPWYWVDHFWSDRDGMFWLATGEAGLSRFDGVRWRNWGEHNAGSEPYPFAGNEPMSGLYQDGDGTHWFGGNGIARWDDATGGFTGFWNWQNNPGMGVTQFPFFAEDAAGTLFAASEFGTVYRYDTAADLWVTEPVEPYAVLGLPGMAADSAGDVWVAAWFDVHHWDGATWSTVPLPDPDFFFDLGGINTLAIGPDDVLWFGTNEGIVRWDGTTFTTYGPADSPLAGPLVPGIAVRDDGVVGLTSRGTSSSEPSGVVVIDGDPSDPANWTTSLYGASPLPHWQIERCAFDGRGDLWVSAPSEGAAVLRLGAWSDAGFGLVGSAGLPRLLGSGTPEDGLTVSLDLFDAAPGAPAALVLGVEALEAPFKGGVLVPDPLVVVGGLPTDADGRLTVTDTWPTGVPSGAGLLAQFWIPDAAGPAGWAASNGVSLVTP